MQIALTAIAREVVRRALANRRSRQKLLTRPGDSIIHACEYIGLLPQHHYLIPIRNFREQITDASNILQKKLPQLLLRKIPRPLINSINHTRQNHPTPFSDSRSCGVSDLYGVADVERMPVRASMDFSGSGP